MKRVLHYAYKNSKYGVVSFCVVFTAAAFVTYFFKVENNEEFLDEEEVNEMAESLIFETEQWLETL